MTTITEVWSTSFTLVLHVHHIVANSFNFLVTWGLSVTIFHSTCIFCVYGMALYWPTLQFYLCVYVSSVCWYMAPPGECYYDTIMLQRLFFIVKCSIACFLCAVRVFEVRASSTSCRPPLCQIMFLSTQSLSLIISCPRNWSLRFQKNQEM